MKRTIRFSVLFLFILSLVIQFVSLPKASAEEAEETITILFTHDMHSNFLPYKSMQGSEVASLGGYARLQTVINRARERDSDALLVDAGDFSMGTPFQTIFSSTSPELRIMGGMGYDAVTLGNHEFDYRADGLAKSLTAAVDSGEKLPQLVQANITFPTDKNGKLTSSLSELKQAMSNYGVKEYIVLERKGIKIGIFGVMGEDSEAKAPMAEVEFEDEVKNAKRIVRTLKEQEDVDLILCLSHSGTWTGNLDSEDEILAKEVPEIDVIISGHTHTKLPEPIVVGDTIIGSAGDNGSNLGVIELSKQKEDWALDHYELIPIDESIPEDETVTIKVAEFKNIVEEEYFSNFQLTFDEMIAKAPFSFPTKDEIEDNHEEAGLGNMICDAFIYAVKQAEGEDYIPIDAAIVPVGTIRGSFFEGEITAADAFSVSSLGIGADKLPGYPLISVYLTGKELKAVCEVDASITPLMSDAQLFISGLTYTFNPNRLIFNKVTETALVRTDGELEAVTKENTVKIEDKKLYRVVAGLYSAQMLSAVGDKSFGLIKIVPKTKEGTPITDFEAQIIFDRSNQSEVKEWYALVSYLKSFDPVNGIPTIPLYYKEAQGRKVVDDNGNVFALVSKPNWIALTVYGIVFGIIGIITVCVVIVVRKIRRRRGQ